MTSGIEASMALTVSVPAMAATSAAGTATRMACRRRPPRWHISMPKPLPSKANLSARCWKKTVIVRTKIVRTWPAAASGTAIAMPAPMLWWPTMTRMAETTDASAASGAMAAPTFIQPSASISSVPPRMIPVVISPSTRPTSVQATSGRWNCASSRTDPMPATAATRMSRMNWIVVILNVPPSGYGGSLPKAAACFISQNQSDQPLRAGPLP